MGRKIWTERKRRTPARDRFVETLENRALLTVSFQLNYLPSSPAGIGFDHPTLGQARRDALQTIADNFGALFDHTATITMDVSSSENSMSNTLASAGSNTAETFTAGFGSEVIRTKVLTGMDLNGATVDGTVDVNWGQPYEVSLDPMDVDGSEIDFVSTMVHEFTHAMGFASLIFQDGTDEWSTQPGNPGSWSAFDQFITNASETPVINASFELSSAVWANSVGGNSANGNGLFFNGPNAKAANGGNPVGLFTPTTWSDGSSVSHTDDENPALAGTMMLSATFAGLGAREYTSIEMGIMMDLGYSFVSQTPTLTVTRDPTSISENGGTSTGTVTLSSAMGTSLDVMLVSSDLTEATVPTMVTIPAGMTAVNFTITAMNDPFDDGDQTVTITASGTGVTSGQADITITDDDAAVAGNNILFFDNASRTFKLGTNTGSGFNWHQTNPLPAPMNGFDSFVGDFDGDGDLDGAVRNRDTSIVNVYTNNGDGTLTGPQGKGGAGTAGTPGFFQIGDYDGNGRQELLWLYLDGQFAGQVFTKDLSTSVTFNMVKANPSYDAFITGDFNGDGFDDLVGLFDNMAGDRTNIIPFYSIASNNPSVPRRLRPLSSNFVLGSFGRSVVNDGLAGFRSADLNGDGKDDIIAVTTSGTQPGQVLHATTTGGTRGDGMVFQNVTSFVSSNRAPVYAPSTFGGAVLLGRFDDNTLADTVSADMTGKLMVGVASLNTMFLNPVVLSDPAVQFGTAAPGASYVVGDFNGDGYSDLAGLGASASVFLSNGGANSFGAALDFGPIIGGGAGQIGAIQAG
ncbi:MAG: VCBS repeat-containing protein [Planctomycetaceae bacterium]|nr:VCBS repeat-containing protein [Planctomycetaceae bacterium]